MLTQLLQPLVLLHLLFAVVLFSLWRRTTTPRRLLLLTILYLMLLLLSMPAVGLLTVRTLEVQNPPLAQLPDDTEAIVVLGTYVLDADTVRPRPELDGLSQVRTRYAAELYHQKKGAPCWVIASAGKADPRYEGVACAEMMAALLRDLGVPNERILVEKQSRTTQENAVECAKLLKEKGVTRIVLVTDACHLVRAAALFRGQGLAVTPAGCSYVGQEWNTSRYFFVPNGGGYVYCLRAFHEWSGLASARWNGQI